MKKYVSVFLLSLSISILAMEPSITVSILENKILTLLEQLQPQPLLSGGLHPDGEEGTRALPVDSYYLCKAIGMMHEGAIKILGERNRLISFFGYKESRRYFNGDKVENCIKEYVIKGEPKDPCSLEELKEAYQKVLRQAVTGWVQISSAEVGDIDQSEDCEDAGEKYFFKKPIFFLQEGTVIRCLIRLLGLRGGAWCPKQRDNTLPKFVYLWTRKSYTEYVFKTLV